MKKLVIQSLESLLRLLVHQPKPVVIQRIIDDIQLQTAKKELSWALIRKSLDKIVGDAWDTALLMLPFLDPDIKNIQTKFDQARQVLRTELDLLVSPEERASVLAAYEISDLKTLLRTKGSKREDLIAAREQFLLNSRDTLTTKIFETQKMGLYQKASRGIYVDTIATGKKDAAEECFQNAFVKFATRFPKIRPSFYTPYFIKTMRTDLIERQISPPGCPVFLPIDLNDDGEPIFDAPAGNFYNPETDLHQRETIQARLQALKAAGTMLLKQKSLVKKKLRQLYILFYLLSAADRPAYKTIAEKFGVSLDTINKDIADVRTIIAAAFEKYGLGVPANALFSKR